MYARFDLMRFRRDEPEHPEPEAACTNGEAPSEEQPKKKKTRRGSRGGRGRKKKTAAPAESDAAPATDGAPEPIAAIAADEEPRLD